MINITNISRLAFTLLTLLATSMLLPADASGQSRVESYLRNADLDNDGRIEPNEMTNPIKRYLQGQGYDITERHRIKEILKKESKRNEAKATSSTPVETKLKVPKFGVEKKADSGVNSFSAAVETVKYSESVTKRANDTFRRYDQNEDRVLDENEMRRANWGSPNPSTNDTNGDGRLSFSEIQARYHDREVAERRSEPSARDIDSGKSERSERGGDRERGGSRRDRFSRSDRGENQNSDADFSKDKSSSRGATASTRGRTSSISKSPSDKSRDYVEKYFSDRDLDKNGILEGDELAKVQSRSKSKYDTNRDGKISEDEMLKVLDPERGSDEPASKTNVPTRREAINRSRDRSGRSSKTSGSFTQKDTNNDKLIQMQEFSDKWPEKKLKEFLTKDKNEDGVISPDEW